MPGDELFSVETGEQAIGKVMLAVATEAGTELLVVVQSNAWNSGVHCDRWMARCCNAGNGLTPWNPDYGIGNRISQPEPSGAGPGEGLATVAGHWPALFLPHWLSVPAKTSQPDFGPTVDAESTG